MDFSVNFKNGWHRYQFICLGHELTYFVKHETKIKKCCTESEVITMLEFPIDNIFVEFWGHIFQQNNRHSYGIKLCYFSLSIFPYALYNIGLCLFVEGSCLIYVICACLRIVVFDTYCFAFLLCFSSFCVPYAVWYFSFCFHFIKTTILCRGLCEKCSTN
jgi:hypothetical protein